jgi:hypothetical protein
VTRVIRGHKQERGVNSPDRRAGLGSAGRGGRGWLKGGELEGEDVASGKRRSEGCVVQKLRRIITCSSCVINHVGVTTCDSAVAGRET